MKFFAPIVVAVVTLFSVQVDANGVCYDPNHGSELSASSVQADMQTISGAGFSSVRTYISKFGNTEMGPIITGAGLTAVLGVPYPQSDYQEQMEAAIKAANAGGVYAIMVGNENLAGASSVPSDMISVINQIKARVSVKVGTVQRNTEVINYQSISGWSELVSACDVLGVNAHPFFNPGTTADGAIDVLDKQWQTMMSSFGDKLLLTETGWPSSGSVAGNTGSLAGEQTFYSAYQKWSAGLSEKFYFQFFDVPSRAEAYEHTFGLYTSNSQPKFGMAQSPSTSSNQQQQQQQAPTTSTPTTQAPAPTTPAPAPEPATEKPQPTTATPTPAPETKQSSGSGETNSSSNYNNNSTSSISSTSGSHEQQQNGSASLSSSDKEAGVSSKNTEEKDSKTDGSKSDKTSDKTSQTTETTAQTAESTVSSIGKSSETQQTSSTSDNTQKANTQSSEGSGASGMVGLAVGGGVCAVLVAFGFIYQIRKRAQELEEDKEQSFSAMTPVENICSL